MGWRRVIAKVRSRGSLRSLARWLFLGTVVVAPWLYGGTTAWSIELMNLLLAVVLVLWVASLLVDRRWPLVPRALAIIVLPVLLQGWWMVLNAQSIYDSTFRSFVAATPFAPGLPGSADYVLSCALMMRVTLLVGTTFLVSEMVQRKRWIGRLWSALVISGASIAALGLVQKATGARMIFWQPPIWPPLHTFFASFVYHANAGAFLNLMLPAAAGLLFWMMLRRSQLGRALCSGALLIIGGAIISNTSRMAQAVAGLLVAAMIAALIRYRHGILTQMDRRTILLTVVVVLVTMFAIGQAARLEQPLGRWREFSENWSVDMRWLADEAALNAVRDAGAFGFGPGTFRAIFPRYQQQLPGLRGTWRFLHEDYLQTVLEWGWLGSIAIASLFFGGIALGVRSYRRARDWNNRQRIFLSGSILALGGVALHAIVDFPLQIFSLQLVVAAYLGVCWGSTRWDARSEGQRADQQ